MSLRIFTAAWKTLWLGTALLLTVAEMFPFDNLHIRPPVFYSYELLKAAAFVSIGFELPLAFWPFNSLNRGLFISLLMAAAIEGVQLFVRGHRFELSELALKCVLIMIGFTFGILSRHDERISFLGVQVRLIPIRR